MTHKNEINMEKIVPFQVFQAHCIERKFSYAGKPGHFYVECRLGPIRCNLRVCPIWNSTRVREIPDMSLRGLNLTLKKATLKKEGLDERVQKVYARPG